MSAESARVAELAIRVAASLAVIAIGAIMLARGAANATRHAKSLPSAGTRDDEGAVGRPFLTVVLFCWPGWAVVAVGLVMACRNV